MASIAFHIRSRPRSFLLASSSSHSHLFSSSSSSPPDFNDVNPQNAENAQSNPKPSYNDLKSHLRDSQPSQQQPPRNPSFNQRAREEIQKNLKEFRLRSALNSPPSQKSGWPISLQELYKKNISERDSSGKPSSLENPMANIKEHLLRTRDKEGQNRGPPSSSFHLSKIKDRIRSAGEETNPAGSRVIGGTSEALPLSVFGKELKTRTKDTAEDENSTELVRDYSFDELGEILKGLRSEGVKKEGDNWFSLSELNERLVKLRKIEIEKKEQVKGDNKNMYSELRTTIKEMQISDLKTKERNQRVNVMSLMGGTQSYMRTPPKEHLIEKYFHPDNMSAADKLKIELKRVRDEFKMSETDCGSTRVQIAQLTTEIIYLQKTLHKKDKHSQKGLLAKVQLRKKLLKYLRGTDWDSYCFILSKFGLRDNPGHKDKNKHKKDEDRDKNKNKHKKKDKIPKGRRIGG